MTKDQKQPKIQHYVPQFLLRNFADVDSKVYVFDKDNGTSFATGTKAIAAEKYFYEYPGAKEAGIVEAFLSKIEAESSVIINDICDKGTLAHLSKGNRKTLSKFISTQLVRVRRAEDLIFRFSAELMQAIEERVEDSAEVEKFRPDEKRIKEAFLDIIKETEQLEPNIENKTWCLLLTEDAYPFIISDNPVTMQNLFDHAPFANLGLAVKGIEIYIPLSPLCCIALYCKTYEDIVSASYSSYKYLLEATKDNPEDRKEIESNAAEMLDMYEAIRNSKPTHIRPEVVDNINSLQVIQSVRFVYSPHGNFEEIKKVVEAYKIFRDQATSSRYT
jgi:hypothetical protein